MKNKLYFVTIFLNFFTLNLCFGQRFGNEWINYNQDYLKITVNQDGIYNISKAAMIFAGFPEGSLSNQAKFQIYFRGEEISMTVNDGGDGSFDNADFIEFFGKKNDGVLDNEVYRPKNTKPHNYFNIYSDDTHYFFTVGANNGKRIALGTSANSALPKETNYKGVIVKANDDQNIFDASRGFFYPSLQLSPFQPYEAWCTRAYNWAYPNANAAQNQFRFYTESLVLTNLDPNYTNINLEGLVHNRSTLSSSKEVKIIAGNEILYLPITNNGGTFGGFEPVKYNMTINSVTNNTLPIKIVQTKFNNFTLAGEVPQFPAETTVPIANRDFFSVGYLKVDYPKLFNFEDNKRYDLNINGSDKSKLEIKNITSNLYGLDITDFKNTKYLTIENGDVNIPNSKFVYVEGTSTQKTIFLSQTKKAPNVLKMMNFKVNGAKVVPSDYDYIIITDATIKSGAEVFANYRKSSLGGSYKPIVLETKQIFNEYFYGERNPEAIKRMADYFLTNGTPQYLFLIGNAYSFEHDMKIKENLDLVPTYGYPGSDIFLTSELNGKSLLVPAIPTGRLPVATNQEILNYLDKVKMHELTRPSGDWYKNVAHIVGNKDLGEVTGGIPGSNLKLTLQNLANITYLTPFGSNSSRFNLYEKSTGIYSDVDITHNPANSNFYSKVNDGLGILTYFGHGSANLITQQFGKVSDASRGYTNTDRFAFLYANGCGISNTFQDDQTSITKDWLLTPHRGSVLTLGQSFLSFGSNDDKYMNIFYKNWLTNTNPTAKKSATNNMLMGKMGNILQSTSQLYVNKYGTADPYDQSNLEILILFGDPSVSQFASSQNAPLPINLVKFESDILNKTTVKLNWEGDGFENITNFQIERSSNNNLFSEIGNIKINSLSKEKYAFDYIDNNPKQGLNYYRLKMVEKDGNFEYSKIIVQEVKIYNELVIFENPIKDNIISFNLNDANLQTAQLRDLNGKIININLINSDSSKAQFKILENIPNGVYFFEVFGNDLTKNTIKIVKNK